MSSINITLDNYTFSTILNHKDTMSFLHQLIATTNDKSNDSCLGISYSDPIPSPTVKDYICPECGKPDYDYRIRQSNTPV